MSFNIVKILQGQCSKLEKMRWVEKLKEDNRIIKLVKAWLKIRGKIQKIRKAMGE